MPPCTSKKIRIALLDDHAVVRFGLSARLNAESDFEVVGIYENGASLIEGLRLEPAEILAIDFCLGPTDIDGISLIRALHVKFPESKILVVSSHYDVATVALALKVGALGFVGKEQSLAKVVSAIRTVASGAIYLDSEMSMKLRNTSAHRTKYPTQECKLSMNSTGLSAREREVIRCFLDGLTITEIAEKFGRSVKTISTQKSTAFRKLGITSDNGLFKIKQYLGDL